MQYTHNFYWTTPWAPIKARIVPLSGEADGKSDSSGHLPMFSTSSQWREKNSKDRKNEYGISIMFKETNQTDWDSLIHILPLLHRPCSSDAGQVSNKSKCFFGTTLTESYNLHNTWFIESKCFTSHEFPIILNSLFSRYRCIEKVSEKSNKLNKNSQIIVFWIELDIYVELKMVYVCLLAQRLR